MSSSYIVEPHEKDTGKKDDTLIIVVNDDGTISVDQETLQNLIMNQSNANVSVVRLGQTDGDTGNGDLTLTVDPPTYVPSPATTVGNTMSSDTTGLVDPFMEMDQEQLERLETALQSEEAKQILGENVTAMLDMLSVEERQSSIRHSIELDHCYTNKVLPPEPKSRDTLPIAGSSVSNDTQCTDTAYSHATLVTASASTSIATSVPASVPTSLNEFDNNKPKPMTKTGKPIGRPRKVTIPTTVRSVTGPLKPIANTIGAGKSTNQSILRNTAGLQQASYAGVNEEDEEEDYPSSSTETSESEPPSDDDSDFGPRGPRRGNVRARGGRKGLTTRGGSMTAARRRGLNKLDMEQVRRLDMEMAAAVSAMKSPEKDDKLGGFSPMKGKRQIKTLAAKRKDDSQPMQLQSSAIPTVSSSIEKPVYTMNQVKRNIVTSAVKSDVIFKPVQTKGNQKVTFVQKQILNKSPEYKTVNAKRQVVLSKGKFISEIQSKTSVDKDVKLEQSPTSSKSTLLNISGDQSKGILIQTDQESHPVQNAMQQQFKLGSVSTPGKKNATDVKKDKKIIEDFGKGVTTPEVKIPDANSKKHPKKDNRKSPGFVVDTLGPALFSTPDIIRRVGSNNESKMESSAVSAVPVQSVNSALPTSGVSITTSSIITSSIDGISTSVGLSGEQNLTLSASSKISNVAALDDASHLERTTSAITVENSAVSATETSSKIDMKVSLPEELQPSLDPGGGEEQLLATLQMKATKHEEELLAEALLLHEELGVDLDAETTTLVDQSAGTTDSITPTTVIMPTMVTTEQELTKPLEAITTRTSTNVIQETPKKHTKDEKQPIQIVRGGRVITLPPIEAPATRSKRLQAQKILDVGKEADKYESGTLRQIRDGVTGLKRDRMEEEIEDEEEQMEVEQEKDDEEDDDEDEEDEDEEDNSDSEDDPDRLWCICKRPHNNRFMICCDVCEDWFHGKCVHVSKAMGQQMEEQGIEWVCPNCIKKKSEDAKMKSSPLSAPGKLRSRSGSATENSVSTKQITSPQITSPVREMSTSISSTSDHTVQYSGTMQCVVCKKEARNSSIYCSDACILAHAQETLTKETMTNKPASTSANAKVAKLPAESPKISPDARIIVFERKTGKILTGSDAPTRSNLKTWLKENPTFEVVRPSNLNTLQIGGRTVTAIQTQGLGKAGKSANISTAKLQTMPKMVYTKIAGSKQTVLAPSNKKLVVVSSAQQNQINTPQSKPGNMKQTLITTTVKTPVTQKQFYTRTVVTQPQQKSPVIIMPKQTPTKKQEIKPTSSTKQQQAQVQQQQQQSQQVQNKANTPKKSETEPIRVNVRKTLTELLSSRIKETDDLKLSDQEISDLALNIELEMYKYFKDTGAKYKAKYRSLVFNIKDTKNLTLFRKIADRSLTPDAVVRLSPDEMASQELAEWREKETKHQLEMIKKNELDLMAQAKSIVVKTHKGEQVIENDGNIDHVDPKTPVQDIVTALNSSDNITSTVDEVEKEKEREKDREKEDKVKMKLDLKRLKSMDDKRRKEKEKDRDKDRSRDRDRDRDKERDRDRSSGRSSRKDRRDRSTSRDKRRRSKDREHSKTRDKSKERKVSKNKESKRDRDRDRDRKDREKKGDKIRTKEKNGEDERDRHSKNKKEKHAKNRGGNERRESKGSEKRDDDDQEHKKKDSDRRKEYTPPAAEKPIEDRLWRHVEDETTTNTIDGNDSDISDREPTSTVTIKTPDINDESEKEKEQEQEQANDYEHSRHEHENERESGREHEEREVPISQSKPGTSQTVWRGFVNMVDVAKFFITAQEVSGQAKDLMDDLPDTVDVVGRISHETVWDYISKMKKTGSKEILVIRLTAANDEEKIPYITLYSYLNSRSRLGVVGNVSKNIKDFYIMPFSNQSAIPPVLLPLGGPGFEEHRPHLLLGIIVRNKRKRLSGIPAPIPSKVSKKDSDRSYTPPLVSGLSRENRPSGTSATPPSSPSSLMYRKSLTSERESNITSKDKGFESNKTSRNVIDSATICKIVPELSSKIDLTSSDKTPGALDDEEEEDDGDEPYSPGEMDEESNTINDSRLTSVSSLDASTSKSSNDLQRKMEEINRQIEEQKQQIQSISSSFLGETTPTLPGLGLDPPTIDESEEAYSPSDTRSFTPPPPISKFAQPILDKVSNITIPPNLQEILANVKRQESSKVDPYLPSKPGATFLTTVGSSIYQNSEKYSSSTNNNKSNVSTVKTPSEKSSFEVPQISASKESKSTLSSLSDLDLIRKAEEELAAVAAATAAAAAASTSVSPSSASTSAQAMSSSLISGTSNTSILPHQSPSDLNLIIPTQVPPMLSGGTAPGNSSCSTSAIPSSVQSVIPPPIQPTIPPPVQSAISSILPPSINNPDSSSFASSSHSHIDSFKKNLTQPKPPGLEDEDFPAFPSTPPCLESSSKLSPRSKFVPKSGIVLSVKRKANEDGSMATPNKTPRTKSRWGQGPTE